MDLIQTSKIKTITLTLILLQFLLLASIFIAPVLGNGVSDNSNNNKTMKENIKPLSGLIFSNNNTSKLEEALQKKRKDLHFYPILYFEGVKTNDVKRDY